jgi:nucleoid DNA-binding protein
VNQYDSLIRDYLYENKQISFEKIGNITLDDKNASVENPPLPASIHFQFNKRAETSPELAVFIAAKTGKNKVLIASDLESFVELMRQFMNIGKPYEMDGVGIFKISRTGEYEFAAFDQSNKKEESKSSQRQKQRERERNDSPLSPKKTSNKNALMLFALVIVLGVLGVVGWGTYKLFIENKNSTAVNTDTALQSNIAAPLVPDTTKTGISSDTLFIKDSSASTAADSAQYKFIYETTSSALRAYERVKTLRAWGHPSEVDSVKRDSSSSYILFFRYKLSVADTASMKDSIQKLLNRKIRIRPA